MPRKDTVHEAVKNALVKDGWLITDDPYFLEYGREDLYVDLAAESLLTAERAGQRIAAEIKSFGGRSTINDLYNALGQYLVYRSILTKIEPKRKPYLAVSLTAYERLMRMDTFHLIRQEFALALIVVQLQTEEIVQWIE